jgi:hypothetical protein
VLFAVNIVAVGTRDENGVFLYFFIPELSFGVLDATGIAEKYIPIKEFIEPSLSPLRT